MSAAAPGPATPDPEPIRVAPTLERRCDRPPSAPSDPDADLECGVTAVLSPRQRLEHPGLSEQRACSAAAVAELAAIRAKKRKIQAALKEIEEAEAEADARVDRLATAPMALGEDPTLWLPDELLLLVLLYAPVRALRDGTVARVCRRWRDLVTSRAIVTRLQTDKWLLYSNSDQGDRLLPRKVRIPSGRGVCEGRKEIRALVVCPTGNVFAWKSWTFSGLLIGWRAFDTVTGRMDLLFCVEAPRRSRSPDNPHPLSVFGDDHLLAIGPSNRLFVGMGTEVVEVSVETGAELSKFKRRPFQALAVGSGKVMTLDRADGGLLSVLYLEGYIAETKYFRINKDDHGTCVHVALHADHSTNRLYASANATIMVFKLEPLTYLRSFRAGNMFPRIMATRSNASVEDSLHFLAEYATPTRGPRYDGAQYEGSCVSTLRRIVDKRFVKLGENMLGGRMAVGMDGTVVSVENNLNVFLPGKSKALVVDLKGDDHGAHLSLKPEICIGPNGVTYISAWDNLLVF